MERFEQQLLKALPTPEVCLIFASQPDAATELIQQDPGWGRLVNRLQFACHCYPLS